MKKMFNLIIIYGIIMIVGTAGASDIGNISFNHCMLQILIALGFICFGALGKCMLAYLKAERLNKMRRKKYRARLRLQTTA